ncbi:MAG: GyrI-like domain-containing protein [Saprospiraceae bacterium]|nr:GyrI-like domain-containing protein [Saprospiraceae bacterium]
MIPKIFELKEKKLIGKRLKMSLTCNRTGELWASFMPRKAEIESKVSNDLISLQIYPVNYFLEFNPNAEFEKWATIEVTDFENLPNDFETFRLEPGLYAVFNYIGLSSNPEIFKYIYGTWLPGSEYLLDSRPHFEVLGEKYKNNDPNSEEEIWIPIKIKY